MLTKWCTIDFQDPTRQLTQKYHNDPGVPVGWSDEPYHYALTQSSEPIKLTSREYELEHRKIMGTLRRLVDLLVPWQTTSQSKPFPDHVQSSYRSELEVLQWTCTASAYPHQADDPVVLPEFFVTVDSGKSILLPGRESLTVSYHIWWAQYIPCSDESLHRYRGILGHLHWKDMWIGSRAL